MSLIPKLLLIDDNEEILVSLKSFLSKRNFDVISASNGLDALKLLEVATHDFDLEPIQLTGMYLAPADLRCLRRLDVSPAET